jgi:large subunit ribosomal protein L18
MKHTNLKRGHRIARHNRIRSEVTGTAQRPRVSVFKSNKHTYVQVIDDVAGKTLVSSELKTMAAKGKKTEVAVTIAQKVAEKMKEKGITTAVFDRGGFKYHGRIKAIAEGLRTSGIKI